MVWKDNHIIFTYISVLVTYRHNEKRPGESIKLLQNGEDADAAAKQLQDREQKVEDQVGEVEFGRICQLE